MPAICDYDRQIWWYAVNQIVAILAHDMCVRYGIWIRADFRGERINEPLRFWIRHSTGTIFPIVAQSRFKIAEHSDYIRRFQISKGTLCVFQSCDFSKVRGGLLFVCGDAEFQRAFSDKEFPFSISDAIKIILSFHAIRLSSLASMKKFFLLHRLGQSRLDSVLMRHFSPSSSNLTRLPAGNDWT